jgi:hypothetical protein
MSAMYDDGGFTTAMYFTSEVDAREGERKELPENLKPMMDELNSLDAEPTTFFDLKQPWFYSPS